MTKDHGLGADVAAREMESLQHVCLSLGFLIALLGSDEGAEQRRFSKALVQLAELARVENSLSAFVLVELLEQAVSIDVR